MGKIKTIIAVAGTLIGSAIVYESTIIGSRALASDMKYLKESPHDGPVYKKHWWQRKKGGK